MCQFVRHPELEVLEVGVEIQVDEGHVLHRQQDVERVAVVLLGTAAAHNVFGNEFFNALRRLLHALADRMPKPLVLRDVDSLQAALSVDAIDERLLSLFRRLNDLFVGAQKATSFLPSRCRRPPQIEATDVVLLQCSEFDLIARKMEFGVMAERNPTLLSNVFKPFVVADPLSEQGFLT